MANAPLLTAIGQSWKVGVALCALGLGCVGVAIATGIHEYAIAAFVALAWVAWRFLPAKRREIRWMGFGSKHAFDAARDVRRRRLGSRVFEQLRDAALADLRDDRRKRGVQPSSRPPSPARVEATLEFELAFRSAAMVRGIDAGLRRPGGAKKDASFERRLQARAYAYLHRNDSDPGKSGSTERA